MLTIDDLGILRDVPRTTRAAVHVTITPTYSGCPAMETISDDLVAALTAAGYHHVHVEFVLAPAWTTDWMTDEGRRKLTRTASRRRGHAGPGRCRYRWPCAARSAAASTRGSRAGSARPPASRCGCAAAAASPSTTSRRSEPGTSDAAFHPLRVASVDGSPTTDRRHLRGPRRAARRLRLHRRPAPQSHPAGGDDVRRSYSLCTPPASGVLRIAVKRLPGGAFSEGVLGRLRPATRST